MQLVNFINAVGTIKHVGSYLQHFGQNIYVPLNIFTANLRIKVKYKCKLI